LCLLFKIDIQHFILNEEGPKNKVLSREGLRVDFTEVQGVFVKTNRARDGG
jgi:hypothetical protein